MLDGPQRAQQRAFHGKRLDDQVGDPCQDLLLLLKRIQELLHGHAGGKQHDLLRHGHQAPLFVQDAGRRRLSGGRGGELPDDLQRGGEQRQPAPLAAAEQHAGDQQPVDLICALEQPVDAAIAVGAGRWIVLNKTVSPVDLHGFVGDIVENFRRIHFVDGALDRILLKRAHRLVRVAVDPVQRAFDQPAGAIRHALRDVYPHRHLRQFVLDETELGQRPAELPPLMRIGDDLAQQLFRGADAPCGQPEPTHVEDVHGHFKALPDLSQDVLCRHRGVLQEDRRGRGPTDAHLVLLFAHRDARRGPIHEEAGMLVPVDFGEHVEQVGEGRVRDKLLRA